MGLSTRKIYSYSTFSVTEEWVALLDLKKEVACVLFNLKKAFDTVPHRRQLQGLEKLQLHPLLLQWIHNYQLQREWVRVNLVSSHWLKTTKLLGMILGSSHTTQTHLCCWNCIHQLLDHIYGGLEPIPIKGHWMAGKGLTESLPYELSSYMWQLLNLPSLQNCRLSLSLCTLYKIIHQQVYSFHPVMYHLICIMFLPRPHICIN